MKHRAGQDMIATTCAYCGQEIGVCRRDEISREMIEHVRHCTAHPLYALLTRIEHNDERIEALTRQVEDLKRQITNERNDRKGIA